MLFILLLANMTAEYKLLASVSQVFFYSVLVLGVVVLLLNIHDLGLSLNRSPEITGLIIIYLTAQFILQCDIISADNIIYTFTKIAVFCIISYSIYSNYHFYIKKTPIIFSYIIVLLVLCGWFINKTGQYGSLQFGFNNRNVACTIATAGFAGFLFMKERLKLMDYACMAFLLITILYGGSRNALAMCMFIIVVRYGFSFKIVGVTALFLIAILYALPELGIETTAFKRLMGTFDGTVALDRERVREIAWGMIAMRPWTGWGYNFIIPQSVGVAMGAHNGYLVLIENLGYPCAIAAFMCIGVGAFKHLKLYKLHNNALNYCLAIVVSTLFAANQESYLVGVNQFTTNYFFVAFVILGMFKYQNPQVKVMR